MKRSELRQIIREEIFNITEGMSKEDFIRIQDIARELFPKWVEVDTHTSTHDFILHERFGPNYIQIKYHPITNEIELFGLIKTEISSVSLADPRVAYQTTSARRVRHKTTRMRKGFKDRGSAEKALRKFAEKLG